MILAGLAVLAGCGLPPRAPDYAAPPEDVLLGCCLTPERYPSWYARGAEVTAPLYSGQLGRQKGRPGLLLAHAGAVARITDRLQPLDLIVLRNAGRKSGRIIPGHFSHVAVYLGTEAELRRAGLWHDAALAPHRAAIRAGRVFVQSDIRGVVLSPVRDALNTDAAAILRPQGDDRHARLAELVGQIGLPFDTSFDLRTADRVSCTQLVQQNLPEMGFPVRVVYGRPLVLPDDIAARALRRSGLSLVSYVIPHGPEGWREAAPGEMIRDLNRFWAAPPPAIPRARQVAPPKQCS
jgi:hypothetical protein